MRITLYSIVLVFLLTSCATKLILDPGYFNTPTKVGFVFKVHDINKYRQGSQGLLDRAVTNGPKYDKPLSAVDRQVDPESEIKAFYLDHFKAQGKSLQFIDIEYDKDEHKVYTGTRAGTKYSKTDFREYKERYDIDELLFVDVKYGVLVSYYGFIETGMEAYCGIKSEIINLTDNSLLFKDVSRGLIKIKEKWELPPDYELLTEKIDMAIKMSIKYEKNKLTFSKS